MNLIREIQLPNGRLTKNLGFGCAGILRLPTNWQREKLLRTAFDSGITHFDVARMYGAGAAEGILGSCLKKMEGVTLATKFGFPCGVPTRRKVLVQSVGRWAVNLHPGLKKRIRQRGSIGGGDRHYDYGVKEMESSLATSLTQLQTERIDLFFVHEPRAQDEVPESLGASLQQQVKIGRIGAYGLSGIPSDISYFLQHRPELCRDAIQFNFSLDKAEDIAAAQVPYTGIFHVLSGSLSFLGKFLERDKAFTKLWSEKLSVNLPRRDILATVILAVALNENPRRMVLFFTSNAGRLRQMVGDLTDNSFSAENLSAFRSALSDRAKEIYAL